MRNLTTIVCILILLALTSVCPEKPLPEKIQINELIIWDTRRDIIQLSKDWRTIENKDSLRSDAWGKMENIKLNRYEHK